MELLEGIDQSELMGMAGLLVDLTPSNGEQRRAVSFGRIPVGSHVAVGSNTIYHHSFEINISPPFHRVSKRPNAEFITCDILRL